MGPSTATYTFPSMPTRYRISAEFYEIRAGERACFSSDILNVFLSLISIWPRLVGVKCDMVLYFPQPLFYQLLLLHSIFGISIYSQHPFPGLSVPDYASRIPLLHTPWS